MVGDVNQKLYLGALPAGLTFTVEEVRAKLAWWQKQSHFFDFIDNEWGVYFYGPNGQSADAYRKKEVHLTTPFSVEPGKEIGRTKFVPGNGVNASGPTGKILIRFCLHGTVNGASKDVKVNQKGYITVGTSDWKGFSRPDYSKITYHLEGGFSMTHDLDVPLGISPMPDDAYFVLGIDPSEDQVGIGITTSSSFLTNLGNLVLAGIFKAHAKALSWAVGKLNPF